MNNSSKCSYSIGTNIRNKIKYKTFEEAQKAANRMNADIQRIIHIFSPYKCTTCNYFHIGKTKKELKTKPTINSGSIKYLKGQTVYIKDYECNGIIQDYFRENDELKYKILVLHPSGKQTLHSFSSIHLL